MVEAVAGPLAACQARLAGAAALEDPAVVVPDLAAAATAVGEAPGAQVLGRPDWGALAVSIKPFARQTLPPCEKQSAASAQLARPAPQ